MQNELAAVDRMAQAVLQRQPLQRAAVHGRREELVGVAPGILGSVHGVIRVLQQRLGGVAVVGEEGDPDAGRDEKLVSLNADRTGDPFQNLLSDLRCVLVLLETRQQNGELIAAHPGDAVFLAERGLQPYGHGFQQLIAQAVAERVVDDLEAIEIEEHDGERPLQPPGVRQGHGQPIAKQTAVGKPGQRVVIGLIFDLLFGVLSLRDVARDGDELVQHSGGRIAHRAAGRLEPEKSAILAQHSVGKRRRHALVDEV